MISHFEFLSNELIHEIFDYLPVIDIIKIFNQLNQRFSLLISRCLFKIDFSYLSKIQYEILIHLIPIHQINALKISSKLTVNILSHIPFSSIVNLRQLTLLNVNYNELKYLFQSYNCFHIFQQLNTLKLQSNNFNGLDYERIFIFKKIFLHMSNLRLCQIPFIDVNDFDDLVPIFTLEKLIVDYCTMTCLGK